MFINKTKVNRRARHVARLADHSRPHGRRRGYAHYVQAPENQRRSARGPSLLALVMMAGVFVFLVLVISGSMHPATGPLSKSEPVTTAKVKR